MWTERKKNLPALPICVQAREWVLERGGATHITSWGKFWLSVLGCYDWMGQNPLPPEMWLLPYKKWTGIGYLHPGRFWCHCRMVYLPMCYIYGTRSTGPLTEVVQQLRRELYTVSYDKVDWNAARSQCAREDLYYPHPKIQDVVWWSLYKLEPLLMGSRLRRRALTEVMKHIHYEDVNTRYVDIGPVNKVINMLCVFFANGRDSEEFQKHLPRLHDYLWVAEDGMKMQGYNGCQLWDTAFAVQALAATNDTIRKNYLDVLRLAHSYLDKSQVQVEAAGHLESHYRHISLGAWPFSTQDHGWPISDCSSEGLKAALALLDFSQDDVGPHLPPHRLEQCVNVILSYQNSDGGWATYENTRSFGALEALNPSETFGDIIVDYSYVECSSACMTALCHFRRFFPGHRREEISKALVRGREFIVKDQRPDGSWYGSWAVCFTYAGWFGCKAFAALGETWENSEPVRQACRFLLEQQRANGGWGESYLSCQDKVYSQLPDGKSHVVCTAWSMLALLAANYHQVDRDPLDRAATYLLKSQERDGGWPQQEISGVFNRNCMISYSNYRYFFPLWALAEYQRHVLSKE